MRIWVIVLILTGGSSLSAEDMISAKLELDGYVTTWGAIYYPRVKWKLQVPGGKVAGFVFVYRDRNPGPWFANHVVVYTPDQWWRVSLRTETGGVGTELQVGPATHQYFFQVGPQLNLIRPAQEKKEYLLLNFLPRLGGIRPHNFLTAASTPKFKLPSSMHTYSEFYLRCFPERGIRRTYGEVWQWLGFTAKSHVQFGGIARLNGGKIMYGFGIRYLPWP